MTSSGPDLLSPGVDVRWQLLTPRNIAVRRLWPWTHSIQKIVRAAEQPPRKGRQVLIVSDYGGDHRPASHQIYCYLILNGLSRRWYERVSDIRRRLLPDGRRIAYKHLGDGVRRQAMPLFLDAAGDLDGHLVAIAVDKRRKWLAIHPTAADHLRADMGLGQPWSHRGFEALLRKVILATVFTAIFSARRGNVTWITDEDDIVANDKRHDDALAAFGWMLPRFVDDDLGIVRLNSTSQDPEFREYEDLCAVPDLAAGMLSDVAAQLAKTGSWAERMQKVLDGDLSLKAGLMADWFWDPQLKLRRTLITIDVEGDRTAVRKVWMEHQPPLLVGEEEGLLPAQSTE